MQDNQETPTDEGQTVRRRWPHSRRGRIAAMLTGAAVLAGGALGVQAFADSKTYQHMTLAASDGGGWHGRDHTPWEEMSDAEIETKVTRGVRHLGIEIDATPEQEARMVEIALGVMREIRPLKERMRLTGEELKSLLTAPTVDRQALEALRAARLAEADRISKTLVGAVADLADVLTPEQRVTVEQMVREKRGRGGRHWRHRG